MSVLKNIMLAEFSHIVEGGVANIDVQYFEIRNRTRAAFKLTLDSHLSICDQKSKATRFRLCSFS